MKNIFLIIPGVLLILAAVSSCKPKQKTVQEQNPAGDLTPEEYTGIRHSVIAYMECEECVDGELDSILHYGKKAVPTLAAIVQNGPSPSNIEVYRKKLQSAYAEMAEYSKTHKEAKQVSTEEQYVKTYLDNYTALYYMRSARALAAIGGDDAKKALQTASGNKALRADVTQEIQEMLKRMN